MASTKRKSLQLWPAESMPDSAALASLAPAATASRAPPPPIDRKRPVVLAGTVRPRLRAISGDAVAILNRLAPGTCFLSRWGGQACQVCVSGAIARPVLSIDLLLALTLDNVRMYLGMSRATAEALVAPQCGNVAWQDIADDLGLALLQIAADELSEPLPELGLGPVCIEGWMPSEAAQQEPFTFELRIATLAAGGVANAYLLTGLDAASRLADFATSAHLAPVAADWGSLPLRAIVELGWVDLSLTVVSTIRVQDILLPDRWWSGKGPRLICLRLDRRFGILAELGDDDLVYGRSGIMKIENEASPREVVPVDVVASDVGELTVRISFDLGEREISVRELDRIAPGHVFDLALAAERAVNVRINGRLVGEAELVEVDGRIGVAITRFAPPRQ